MVGVTRFTFCSSETLQFPGAEEMSLNCTSDAIPDSNTVAEFTATLICLALKFLMRSFND